MTALRAGNTEVTLDGLTSPLMPTAGIFTTMNPGYAGRTELPTIMKDLFRSCPMMIPDYCLIA